MNHEATETIQSPAWRILIMFAVVLSMTGCSLFPKNWGKDEGYIWCNARYLDLTSPEYKATGSANPALDKRLRLAQQGYLYAVLGAVVLQKEQESVDKHFNLPPYVELDSSQSDRSGFQASVFKIYTDADKANLKEVVIAFRGTDQFWTDYSKHNLHPLPKQYEPARQYVLEVSEKFEGKRLIVAGYSLGGGLAMHVLNNDQIAEQTNISEAWAFNSSPRTGEPVKVDSRLHLISTKGEILNFPRKFLRKGPSSLGALDRNFSDDFDLIDASSAYLHARFVLARQMLVFADLAYFEQSGRNPEYISPPLAILQQANAPEGCSGSYKTNLTAWGRL